VEEYDFGHKASCEWRVTRGETGFVLREAVASGGGQSGFVLRNLMQEYRDAISTTFWLTGAPKLGSFRKIERGGIGFVLLCRGGA